MRYGVFPVLISYEINDESLIFIFAPTSVSVALGGGLSFDAGDQLHTAIEFSGCGWI